MNQWIKICPWQTSTAFKVWVKVWTYCILFEQRKFFGALFSPSLNFTRPLFWTSWHFYPISMRSTIPLARLLFKAQDDHCTPSAASALQPGGRRKRERRAHTLSLRILAWSWRSFLLIYHEPELKPHGHMAREMGKCDLYSDQLCAQINSGSFT